MQSRLAETRLVLQIGNNRRFDPGIAYAQQFIADEMGQRMGLKAWYYDCTYRYTMTDNLQPIPVVSKLARRPEGNPKADKRRYFMLTHGSHLVDSARFLGGRSPQSRPGCSSASAPIAGLSVSILPTAVWPSGLDNCRARRLRGRLSGLRREWQRHGQGRVALVPQDQLCGMLLGQGPAVPPTVGRRCLYLQAQIEGFAKCILQGVPLQGAGIDDGIAAMRAMVAIARSVETGKRIRLSEVSGGV